MQESPLERDSRLLAMAGDDRNLAVELVGIFLEHYDEMHENLKAAVRSEDPLEVRRVVHAIEGSLGAMGSREAIDHLLALGQAGRDEEPERFNSLFRLYDEAIQRSNEDLRRFVESRE